MTKYCYVCGQKMDRTYWDEYIYKADVAPNKHAAHDTVYFCGWNCMRKYEKERKAGKKAWQK